MEKKYMFMSSISKINIILTLLLISGFQSFGQFSVQNYLSAPFQNAEISGLATQLEYIDDNSFRSPVFREMEIRLRTDDLNFSPDDIRFRLGFINPFEQIANRKYANLQTEYLELKYDFETNKLLANRYKQLIRHYYLNEYVNLLTIEVDQLTAAYELMQNDMGNFKEWIETDERILKKELKRKEVRSSVEMLEYLIREVIKIDDSIYWNNFEFISTEKMQEVLLPDTIPTLLEIELAMKSFQLGQKAYKVEKAESWSNIGFIQAEYDLKDDNPLEENLGFQLGITIPVFNPDKPKLQQRKLELIEQEAELQEIKDECSTEQFELHLEFRKHIWSYQQVSSRLNEVELLGEKITYENMEEYISLVNYHSNLCILKHEIYLNCLETYIEILAESGRLSKAPYINYISNKLEAFNFK